MLETLVTIMTEPISLGPLRFAFSPLALVTRLLLPLAGLLVGYRLLRFTVRKFVLEPLQTTEETTRKVLRWLRLAFRIAFVIVAAFLVNALAGSELDRYARQVWQILTTPLVEAGSSSISVITIILTIPVFYVAVVTGRLASRFVRDSFLQRIATSDDTRFVIGSLINYLVLGLVILIGLSMIGINLSSLAVLFGVLGIGVGFGLQGVIANFVAGLVIIFERPIKEGDRIRIDGIEGDVLSIRMRSTIVDTLTHETIIVPNNSLIDGRIHNYSHRQPEIIAINEVTVAYSADLEVAREVLLSIGSDNPYGIPGRPLDVRVKEFQDSGILMQLWTWIRDAKQLHVAKSWANFEIWKRFRDSGVTIPFPQRDLYIKELPPELRQGN